MDQNQKKLFVGGLPWATTDQELQDAFSQAGSVVSAVHVTDKMTGRARGFGFVEMSTPAEAEAAINMWNGKELGGRTLSVRHKQDNPPQRRDFGGR